MHENRSIQIWLITAVFGFWLPRAMSAEPVDSPADRILIQNCKLEYVQSSLVGTPESGVIKECLVRRGDKVKTGQVLFRLLDGVARAEMDISALEIRSDLDLRLIMLKHKQSLIKFRASSALCLRNALSTEQLKMDQIDCEIAGLAVDQAKQRREQAKLLHARADEAFRAKHIVSPHDGIVSDVLKKQGESALIGEPVLRVDNVDRLQIVGRLDVVDCWRVRAGQKASIRVDVGGAKLPIELETLKGAVVFLDTKIDPQTQTCVVVAEIENRGQLLRAGLEAAMTIEDKEPEQEPKAAPTRSAQHLAPKEFPR